MSGGNPPQAPNATNDSYSTGENTPYNGSLSDYVSNPSAATLTFAITSDVSNGVLVLNDVNTGSFTYTPDNFYDGADSFAFSVTNSGGSDTATVSVTVVEYDYTAEASYFAEYVHEVGLWQDTGGVTAAGVSDVVARWDDQSGNGRNAVQIDAARNPTRTADGLQFTPGTTPNSYTATDSEALRIDWSDLVGENPTIFLVAESDARGTFSGDLFSVIGSDTNGEGIRALVDLASSPPDAITVEFDGDADTYSYDFETEEVFMQTIRRDDTNLMLRQDGVLVGQNPSSAALAGLDDLSIARQLWYVGSPDAFFYFSGVIYHILAFSDDLSDGKIAMIENKLAALY